MNNDLEIDLQNLACKVFIEVPKPTNYFNLSFDAYDLKELFEMLLTFFVEGLKKLYGDTEQKVNLNLLTEKEFSHIKKCMKSINIGIDLEIKEKLYWELYHKKNFIPYNKIVVNNNTKLTDLKVDLLSGDFYYIISFNNRL
jgi:hypothetical protein